MSETAGTGADGGASGAQQPQPPRLSIQSQYVKDLSFENPRSPGGLQAGAPRPEIQITVDVNARGLGEDRFEVTIAINTQAKAGEDAVFVCELSYGGVFAIANVPQESLQALLMIECPRLLFPFVRRIIADVTRDGGFPPLMLDPIDFVTLYRRKLQAAQQQAAAASQNTAGPS